MQRFGHKWDCEAQKRFVIQEKRKTEKEGKIENNCDSLTFDYELKWIAI